MPPTTLAEAAEAQRALANVLGALALVVTDELGRSVTEDVGSVTDAATLSALAQFLDGATVDRVHQVLGLTPSGAVRLVDRLEGADLVTRSPGPDGRSRAVRLTDAGRERALAVVPSYVPSPIAVNAPLLPSSSASRRIRPAYSLVPSLP